MELEKLVVLVKDHEGTYNSADKNYRNRDDVVVKGY
jgi:hypothetical protein